jgi:hypothetical protein
VSNKKLSANVENNDRLRSYLLGVIPWEEASDIEQRLLGDAEFYEELLVAEDELVDLYVRDRLPPSEKQRFESHFLATTERQQKASFGKLFADYLASQAAAVLPPVVTKPSRPADMGRKTSWLVLPFIRRHPVLSFATTTVVCIGLVAALWFGFRENRPELRTGALQVALAPGSVRDGGITPRIQVAAGIPSVEFELQTGPGAFQNYQAEVLYDTERVWQEDHLKPGNKSGQTSVLLVVPAERLKAGYYQIKLSGVSASGQLELVDRYAFRVTVSGTSP